MLDLEIPDLRGVTLALLRRVPPGRVTTYGALAEALGDPIAGRWVGQFLLDHPHDDRCPCHRVVRQDGQIGEYIAKDPQAKSERLRAEGVRVQGGRVDIGRYLFKDFEADRKPLEGLRRLQEELVEQVSLTVPDPDRHRLPRAVAGVDVSYLSAGEGVAVYALVRSDSGKLVWSTTLRRTMEFPYIPSYLAFRELPIALALLDRVRSQAPDKLAEVILVDGNGILHPRHAGIATHLGVLAALPTVGVTKRLLCGEVDLEGLEPGGARPVRLHDRTVGAAVLSRARAKPIYVSPGHLVDAEYALRVVRPLLRGHRLPEPLYWAHRLGQQAVQAEAAESESKQLGLF